VTDTEAPTFRLAYVPGVTPSKWVGVWRERLPQVPLTLMALPAAEGPRTLQAGGADAGLVRLPVDRTTLSAIPLYTETTVVVVPKEHRLAESAELAAGDLAEEIVLHPLDDVLDWGSRPGLPAKERPATTSDAIELVAAGIGVVVVPQSLARLHHRRDLVYRPLTDAPQSQVALSWLEDRTTDLVEEFIGIVRGRTVNSSRGRAESAPQPKQQPKQQRSATGDRRQQGGQGGSAARAGGGRPRGGSGKPRAGAPKGGKSSKRGRPRG
jgi:DNA-binding transcriptional LysR family regulator